MNLLVNGAERTFEADPATLEALIAELELSGQPLLIEHNGTALHPAQQKNLILSEGDRLELLRMVAGG